MQTGQTIPDNAGPRVDHAAVYLNEIGTGFHLLFCGGSILNPTDTNNRKVSPLSEIPHHLRAPLTNRSSTQSSSPNIPNFNSWGLEPITGDRCVGRDHTIDACVGDKGNDVIELRIGQVWRNFQS